MPKERIVVKNQLLEKYPIMEGLELEVKFEKSKDVFAPLLLKLKVINNDAENLPEIFLTQKISEDGKTLAGVGLADYGSDEIEIPIINIVDVKESIVSAIKNIKKAVTSWSKMKLPDLPEIEEVLKEAT